MFAVVRRYSGLGSSVVDDLVANASDVCAALSQGAGSRACDVIATREGLLVVAVGDDEDSVIEAGRRFVAWADRHAPAVRAITPELWAGEVLVHGAGPATGTEGGTL